MPKWTIILIILLVAAVFRFAHLDSFPPGLYPDEAMNGNNALQALDTGDYKVFYPENNGREGLFINLQAMSVAVFENHAWALRIVSAIFGMFTVLGLYLLAQRLFNWQIATLSSYLMAIAFWHVNFSRIGFRAIMAPFLLVWGMYFLWRGLSSSRLRDFAISGIFWGLGFYTYIAFRVMPLMLLLTLWGYWYATKKDFGHAKYEFARTQLLRGLSLFFIAAVLVALPLGFYFWTHQADFLGRTGQLSIFASSEPLKSLALNTVKSFGIFNFAGDWNWRHNFGGQPILLWPVGIFFILGFFRSWIKLFKTRKSHGHFSTVHLMLLSWFFIGMLPTVLSNEGLPHALRTLIVAPVVFIWAGEGLWWIMDKIGDFYHARDTHEYRFQYGWLRESAFFAVLAVVVLLVSLTIAEYDKYFNKWGRNLNTAAHFNQNYVKIGEQLNAMSKDIKKYVLVNAGGVLVNDIPMPAQTVMYLTDTYTPEKQKEKNIYYLTEEQYKGGRYDRNSVVIPLEDF